MEAGDRLRGILKASKVKTYSHLGWSGLTVGVVSLGSLSRSLGSFNFRHAMMMLDLGLRGLSPINCT